MEQGLLVLLLLQNKYEISTNLRYYWQICPQMLTHCPTGTWNMLQIIIGLAITLLCVMFACSSFICISSLQRITLYTVNTPTGTVFFWKQARQTSSKMVMFHNYYLIATFSSSVLQTVKQYSSKKAACNFSSQLLFTNRLDYQVEIIRRSLWSIHSQRKRASPSQLKQR